MVFGKLRGEIWVLFRLRAGVGAHLRKSERVGFFKIQVGFFFRISDLLDARKFAADLSDGVGGVFVNSEEKYGFLENSEEKHGFWFFGLEAYFSNSWGSFNLI